MRENPPGNNYANQIPMEMKQEGGEAEKGKREIGYPVVSID